MKRFLAILLAALMVMALIPAMAEDEFPDHIEIEISMWELDGFGNDPIGQFLEEKFNCDIVNVLQEWSDYQEKFALLATADTLPDSFAGDPLSEAWFSQFVADELIRPIPLEMIEKYPTLYAMCQSSTEWQLCNDMYDGVIYYIPRMLSASGAVKGTRDALLYRKDWAETVGITEAPTDMDALLTMLTAFAKNDPDADGSDNTFGLVGSYTPLYYAFGAYPDRWVNVEDGVTYGWLDKEPMVKALTWLRTAYENGAIDPEMSNDRTKWASGTHGAFLCGAADAYWLNRYLDEEMAGAYPDKGDPLDYVGMVAAFSETAGAPAHKALDTDTSGTVFAYDTTDEQVDRLLAIYDYLLTDEGNMLRYWGIEGEDYEYQDGKPVKITDEVLRTKYPSIFIQNWPSWDHDFLMDVENGDPTIRPEIKELAIAGRTASNDAADFEKINLLAGYMPSEEKRDFVFDIDAELAGIITGTEDVEAMYDTLVEKAKANGVEDVVASINALLG